MTSELTAEETTLLRDLFLAYSKLQELKIFSDEYIPTVEAFNTALWGLFKNHPNFNPISRKMDFDRYWYGNDDANVPEYWKEPRIQDHEMTPFQLILTDVYVAYERLNLLDPTYSTILSVQDFWNDELAELFTYSPNYNKRTGEVKPANAN